MTPDIPRKDTPAGNDADKSGYAERTPRDGDDARNVGVPYRRDPDHGGLDRKPEDSPDTAADEG
ncbi:hypothetical protein E5843_06025 [Luteimonas yindakuii]|uniref:hypothetical protein n=1 Tax=Luteimonas yindakuii TaxID=2565782 RepID=UPI0010A550E2|nr:hypothetical protein [Luteimonas yindakuii]QCO67442.1 hypothetical protein E5843_06025 [Luteimonas yindakuii]